MVLKAGYATQTIKFDTIMESIKQVEIKAIRKNKKVTGKDGRGKRLSSIHIPNERVCGYVDPVT